MAPAVESTCSIWNSSRVSGVSSRHSQIAEHELREKCQIEAEKDGQSAKACARPSGYILPLIFGHQ